MMRRRPLGLLITAAAALFGSCVIAIIGGYRLNLTPSAPVGLWRIEHLDRPVAIGDLVFICPPPNDRTEVARRLGYLRWGPCAGGFAPLVKTVAALAGQRIAIGAHVVIDGSVLHDSVVLVSDGQGRPIQPFAGGMVPSDCLFLHSSFASSYDSRYFGPVPVDGLLGLARPVLTFDP